MGLFWTYSSVTANFLVHLCHYNKLHLMMHFNTEMKFVYVGLAVYTDFVVHKHVSQYSIVFVCCVRYYGQCPVSNL